MLYKSAPKQRCLQPNHKSILRALDLKHSNIELRLKFDTINIKSFQTIKFVIKYMKLFKLFSFMYKLMCDWFFYKFIFRNIFSHYVFQ